MQILLLYPVATPRVSISEIHTASEQQRTRIYVCGVIRDKEINKLICKQIRNADKNSAEYVNQEWIFKSPGCSAGSAVLELHESKPNKIQLVFFNAFHAIGNKL